MVKMIHLCNLAYEIHFPASKVVVGAYFLRQGGGFLPGMTGPRNSFTARGPVSLTAILFTQLAV